MLLHSGWDSQRRGKERAVRAEVTVRRSDCDGAVSVAWLVEGADGADEELEEVARMGSCERKQVRAPLVLDAQRPPESPGSLV